MSDLPVVATFLPRVAEYPAGAVFGPRRLHDHELVWLLEGAARWRVEHPDGHLDEVELRPGTLVLARPGDLDRYEWSASGPSRHAYLHFTGELPDGSPRVVARELAGSPPLGALCGYLETLSGRGGPLDRRRCDAVLALVIEHFLEGPDPRSAWTPGPRLAPMIGLVRSRWEGEGMGLVPVDRLARACGLSPGHFSRTFRETTGASPAAALELVRLARAATLLQRANLGVAEVARVCGFADAYHFSHRFSATYGSPPGRYRRLRPEPDPLAPLATAGLQGLWRALTDV